LSVKDTRDRERKAGITPYPAWAGQSPIGGAGMNNTIARAYLRIHDLMRDEQGQDMVEYALLVSLIALLCIAGISHIAVSVNGTFSSISSSLA